MKLLGIPDAVEKPIIKANGTSISAVMVEMEVGEIATCSFQIPPEFADQFSTYGQIVTISAKSSSANGTIFRGKLVGQGFSNMRGNLSCRIDLVHEAASQLDSSSSLFPGNMCGSAADNEAYLKRASGESSTQTNSDPMVMELSLSSNFGEDVKNFLRKYMSYTTTSSTRLESPGETEKILSAIGKMWSLTGQMAHSDIIQSSLSKSLNAMLQSGSVSTTFWNILSSFFSMVDLVMVCKSNGELLLMPNFAGISDDGSHTIPSDWVAAFDQSSKYERTPTKVNILVSDLNILSAGANNVMGAKPRIIGSADVESAPAGASGYFNIDPPNFCGIPGGIDQDLFQPVMDTYAKVVGIRELGSLMTCNVVCPLILDVFPGVPTTFRHLSRIKSFSGGSVSSFNKTFSGYVRRVSHEISTDGYPKTKFVMTNVTNGSYKKASSHPFWAGAIMPPW